MYTVPEEYFFRLHHVRPRFKNNVENVLIFMATEIAKLGVMKKDNFKAAVNKAVLRFPGNAMLVEKTVNNWRTEISALFGFIQEDNLLKVCKPGLRAIELAERQDLIQSFKVFLYNFQYPGGHIKPHENAKLIQKGIRFKPVQYILKLLEYAERVEGKRIALNKAEVTHCIFNDLRCTRDNQDVSVVWKRIKANKESDETYDWTGDVIRYAGDILDYMVIANLLVCHGNNFYINWLERQAIYKYITSNNWFSEYDVMINNETPDLTKIKEAHFHWFSYVNTKFEDKFFETDILAFISSNEEEYESLKKVSNNIIAERVASYGSSVGTKEIGDWGENLIHSHECERVKLGGRGDLLHLIKAIPTQFAVGYDIQSVELNELKRYIEVKTTISSKAIDFNKFHLTTNEWNAATTLKDRYYVYRLYLNKESRKLFVMQDPIRLYKDDKLQITPRDGVDLVFNPEITGHYEELLSWQT
ncbi:protein NO VEIN domain-containing protein [Clostridium amazonitimonense]|uniref:protein NO VEIN domain-containing protein n=1 Tax=Clostridium amazonitimonense TaxID=1499689 RepID=UPI0005095412|nr:DUF3883 domain-containing protein [Clostridium amazonitimonense]